MKKIIFIVICALSTTFVSAQRIAPPTSPSVRLKAFVEPTAKSDNSVPNHYYIYLITNKVPYMKLEKVWINNKLYTASLERVTEKPILHQKGTKVDTLVKYTDELVWKVNIKGKADDSFKPKSDISDIVAQNELVLRLYNSDGTLYTREVKQMSKL
jgi:hypothetical protein